MNCIIIEDQAPAQRILKKYIEDMGTLQLEAVFADPLKALAYLDQHSVNLIFLDIDLPKISGIAFLKNLPTKPQVILTTAHSEYALEGYELDVVDYLLKPFSFERFLKAVMKVSAPTAPFESLKVAQKQEYFIKIGYEYVRIALVEILYLEADGDYCIVHLANKKYSTSENLKKWLEILEDHLFHRIHKSFVINSASIDRISGTSVYLKNGVKLPLGRKYKEAFLSQYLH